MGLLSRTKSLPDQAPRPTPRPEPEARVDARSESLGDGALDTLAAVLRLFGKFAFDTDSREAESLRNACFAWARHVLTGAAVEGVAAPGRRAWPDVVRYFGEERAQEQRFVEGRLSGFKDVIFEFIEGFRQLHTEDVSHREEVANFLDELEQTARTDSVEAMRRLVPRVVVAVRSSLEHRNALLDDQMAELGLKLRSLREDLLQTRRQLELDPLTGLYNRGAFDATIARFVDLSVFSGQAAVLFLIDLDDFKYINDRNGHQAGDAVLRAVGNVLVRTFPRKDDFVARYGGDEFAVLLTLTEAGDEERLVERLLDNFRSLVIDYSGTVLRVTCSVGYSRPVVGDTSESLIGRADKALYEAKAAGRDRSVSSRPEQAVS